MKRLTVGLLALSALVISLATLMVITRGQDQNSRRSSSEVNVTPIQEGVMSPTQRLHSKLYENNRRRKLRDLPNPVELVISTPWGVDDKEQMPGTFDEFLQLSLCSANVVLVGIVKTNQSQLTTDGTFVFTDSDITVEEVIKGTDSTVQTFSNILVTRPGGAVDLNGKVLKVRDKAFQPLQVNHKYLLFLRSIPATGAYQQLNSKSGFELSQNSVKSLTDENLAVPIEQDISPTNLIARVRAAATKCQRDAGRASQ
jgi:hypothetical protein